VQSQRERARLFDRQAERYDRCRPGYPDEVIDEILGPSPRGLSVLDVASGTGIASRPMARRGAQVLGVELNANMAGIALRHGVLTEVDAFETWDPAGRTFDRVTCAQAWHWLDQHVSTDKAASVLRPGGKLCLFWSIGRYPDGLADALLDAHRRALPADSPRPSPDFSAVTDALDACDTLADINVRSFPWHRMYSRDDWLDELQSHSDHAALPLEIRQGLLDEVGSTIDGFGGTFRMTYATILISATRL
jgi:SAM-dependent methyltransferase